MVTFWRCSRDGYKTNLCYNQQNKMINQKGLQNINQSPDIKPGTEVSKRAYTARCKRAFLSLKGFCHSSCWKKTFGPTKRFFHKSIVPVARELKQNPH